MKKLILLNFIFINFIASAQIQIKGTVVDGLTNESLIGANVIVKNTSNGTATDIYGIYKILHEYKLPATLIVSYIGYRDLEIEINSNKPRPIRLFSDSKNLKEVQILDNR